MHRVHGGMEGFDYGFNVSREEQRLGSENERGGFFLAAAAVGESTENYKGRARMAHART